MSNAALAPSARLFGNTIVIEAGDFISFHYESKGETRQRIGKVDKVSKDETRVTIFDATAGGYRQFYRSKMENLRFI